MGAPSLDWHFVPSHIAEGPPEVRHADGWLVCETCSDEYARLMAAAPGMMEALRAAQSALAMMIAPDAIKKTTVANAFAVATAAESKVRAALARAEGRS